MNHSIHNIASRIAYLSPVTDCFVLPSDALMDDGWLLSPSASHGETVPLRSAPATAPAPASAPAL